MILINWGGVSEYMLLIGSEGMGGTDYLTPSDEIRDKAFTNDDVWTNPILFRKF